MQYFTGDTVFQKRSPINPADFSKFRKRAGIEPVIGRLKSDRRMIRNYLRGTLGDAINTLLAAVAYNLWHWMNKLPYSSFVSCLLTFVRHFVRQIEKLLFENQQQYPRLRPILATLAE